MGEATIAKAVGKSFEAEGSSTDRALCARTSSHLSRNVAPESSNVQLRGGVPAQGYPAPRVLFTLLQHVAVIGDCRGLLRSNVCWVDWKR